MIAATTTGPLSGAISAPISHPAPELVGVAEIAGILGVSRQRASAITRSDGFPPPIAHLAQGDVWMRPDVTAFAETRAAGARPGPKGTRWYYVETVITAGPAPIFRAWLGRAANAAAADQAALDDAHDAHPNADTVEVFASRVVAAQRATRLAVTMTDGTFDPDWWIRG